MPLSFNNSLDISSGSIVQVASQQFLPWVSQNIRLYANSPAIEFESRVGPIDISDGIGKEIISRFQTDLFNYNQFYTDSQGQEMILRTLDHRNTWNYTVFEPVAGNYYPVCQAIAIRDNDANIQYTFTIDRNRGGSSLEEGEFETMLHRRLLDDDSRGVDEALNETTVIYTRDYLLRDTIPNAAKGYRTQMQKNINPIQFSFGDASSMNTWISNYNLVYSPLNSNLPLNVYMQTLRPVVFPQSDNRFILRLRHIYQVGEDANLSKPVTIDITNLFKGRSIANLKEMNLLGTIELSQIKHMTWRTDDGKQYTPKLPEENVRLEKITLNPQQTRTFMINLQP